MENRRSIDVIERIQQYEEDIRSGYAAFLDGRSQDIKSGSPGWIEGWNMAKDDMSEGPPEEIIPDDHLPERDDIPVEPEMEDENLRQLADYSEGFQAGMDGKQFDDSKSKAWHRGWAEAQE